MVTYCFATRHVCCWTQVELGVERYRSIQSFGNAAISVQAGNKVGCRPACTHATILHCTVFMGGVSSCNA